jgi:hypothetical protein
LAGLIVGVGVVGVVGGTAAVVVVGAVARRPGARLLASARALWAAARAWQGCWDPEGARAGDDDDDRDTGAKARRLAEGDQKEQEVVDRDRNHAVVALEVRGMRRSGEEAAAWRDWTAIGGGGLSLQRRAAASGGG